MKMLVNGVEVWIYARALARLAYGSVRCREYLELNGR